MLKACEPSPALVHGRTTITMNDPNNPTPPAFQPPVQLPPLLSRPERENWFKRSYTFRAIIVGILVLLLLIPLAMVQDLIGERAGRKAEAEAEVSRTWGGAQTIVGPVIDVPYEVLVQAGRDAAGNVETRKETRHMHFLPEVLNVSTTLDPNKKHRGIYNVAVYASRTRLTGSFKALSSDGPAKAGLLWDQAKVVLGVSDLRSIKEQVTMRIGERTVTFEPGLDNYDVISSGLSAALPLDSTLLGRSLDFEVDLRINGSSMFDLVPVGKVTKVECSSTWKDPSFNGAFLPDTSSIRADGFTAKWTVLHLNRQYPQEFVGSRREAIEQSAFGVFLIQPVDEYQKNTRASKYGLMLIVLVFLVFFFVEVLQKLRIHPIQYLLAGFALCIFYTLLIAISEHLGFGPAYIISALAVIGLVVFYSTSVFKVKRATQLLGLIMLLVFGFMFALIHEQDYALLFGSIGLFIVLALVMAVSRRIDWNAGRE
jgi:inner membrane protein